MSSTADAAAGQDPKRAFYQKYVESGKQAVYQLKNRDKKRETSVLKRLPPDKMHLLEPILNMLSQHKRSSTRLIDSCIYKCNKEHERSLAASASGRSADDNAASTSLPNNIQTVTSTEDTPSQVPANQDADAAESTSPTASENSSNTAVAAAAAPTVITPDKPDDTCQTSNDEGDPSAFSASEDANGLSEDDDFINFSDADENYDNASPSSVEPVSDSEQEPGPVPTKKRRRLTREVDALVRSLPGSLPLDGNDWTKAVQPMALWKAYGLDKVPQHYCR